ncbi:MAG TPA: flagellar biosynthesis protein FliQ [Anaerolineaceae bacterium]|nr:flagellar biosynthesis protein FliQ [Anaerolineaceae bacterium]
MSEAYMISLAQNAMTITLMIAGPVLIVSLIIGVLVSLIQAATQINEVTLSFIPKIIGISVVMMLLGSWMMQQLISFTAKILNSLPDLVH